VGQPARRAARGPLACLPLTAARWAAASPPGLPVRLLGHLHRCRALLGRLLRWATACPVDWLLARALGHPCLYPRLGCPDRLGRFDNCWSISLWSELVKSIDNCVEIQK